MEQVNESGGGAAVDRMGAARAEQQNVECQRHVSPRAYLTLDGLVRHVAQGERDLD